MQNLSKELIFKKDWIFDPPSDLITQFEFRDLAKLAVIQLRAERAMIKVYQEALEEATQMYRKYAGK